jgi:hypothetical protein
MPGAKPAEIVQAIKDGSKDDDLASALYRLIPVAFCRIFLPEVTYSDEFVVHVDEHNQQHFSFSNDRIYNAVLAESKARFPKVDAMPILYHSSDFHAINGSLHNGSRLENLVASPTIFM